MITSPNAAAIPTAPSDPPRSEFTTIAPQPAKTSANVPNASARHRRPRSLRTELDNQPLDARGDLIADSAHGRDVLPRRVVDRPVLVTLSRIDRTGIAAAHRDDDVGGPHDVVRERLRVLLAHVDAQLAHRLDHGRIDDLGGIAPGRP